MTPEVEQQTRSIHGVLARYYGTLAGAPPAETHAGFRWLRLIGADTSWGAYTVSSDRSGTAYSEVRACQAAAKAAGGEGGLRVPSWEALRTRGMSTTPGQSGGFLVPERIGDPVDVLAPWSVVARAGIQMIEVGGGELVVPRALVEAAGKWVAPFEPIGDGAGTLGTLSATPRTFAVLVEISLQLRQQSNADTFVRGHLAKSFGRALDRAVLAGAGGKEPIGLLANDAIPAQSGTSFAWSSALTMLETAGVGDDSNACWIGALDVRKLLQNREGLSGSGRPIWHDNAIAGRPAYASSAMPSGTLLYGDFSHVLVPCWGLPRIEIDSNFKFATGGAAIRLLADVDAVPLAPTAFCRSTSVT